MKPSRGRPSTAKLIVIAAVVGAVVFAAYIGYLAFVNESFPVEERPFADYATMASAPQFNGTEVSFHLRWLNSSFLPVKAQITSATSQAANSPTCYTDLQSVSAGQVLAMPFSMSSVTPIITDVQLSVDVRTLATGHEFTIVYTANNLSAMQGNVQPVDITCQESAGAM